MDLIVLGARGRGKLARLLMGSVSTAVVTEARCSVRVSRENAVSGLRTDYDPVNVLVAVDGSEHADRAVQEAANRHWPQGSTAVILAVIDARMAGAVDADLGRARALSGQGDGDSPLAWVDLLVSEAAATLSGAGLDVRPTVLQGDPKVEILRLAEEQAIDLIFLGARGLSRVERMLLGSISQGVVTRAPCTVEVVR